MAGREKAADDARRALLASEQEIEETRLCEEASHPPWLARCPLPHRPSCRQGALRAVRPDPARRAGARAARRRSRARHAAPRGHRGPAENAGTQIPAGSAREIPRGARAAAGRGLGGTAIGAANWDPAFIKRHSTPVPIACSLPTSTLPPKRPPAFGEKWRRRCLAAGWLFGELCGLRVHNSCVFRAVTVVLDSSAKSRSIDRAGMRHPRASKRCRLREVRRLPVLGRVHGPTAV